MSENLVFTPYVPVVGAPHSHVDVASDLGLHNRQDVVCVNDVSFAYDRRAVLRNIKLHVKEGSILGIIGPNGGGKSTLMKLMLGLLKPTEGTIEIMGQAPQKACADGSLVGYVPQKHVIDWNFPISVRQVVQLGLIGRKRLFLPFTKADRVATDDALAAVDMGDFGNSPIGALSGGQQQRVFIARALINKPKILFLDEPTTGIDHAGQEKFVRLIDTIKRQFGLTIVMVSHDLRSVVASCDRVACLSQSLHYHDHPRSLSRDVLFKVFQCDLDAVLEQHAPVPGDNCCGHDHGHDHGVLGGHGHRH